MIDFDHIEAGGLAHVTPYSNNIATMRCDWRFSHSLVFLGKKESGNFLPRGR
jgi:hypothetical protein